MPDGKISIVIPVLNDAQSLSLLLPALQDYRRQGHELLVVDGGSTDGSLATSRKYADKILMTGPGRGRQMNLGAESASHDTLLFLHADSRLPDRALDYISNSLAHPHRHWGRFDIQLDRKGVVYSTIGFMMNLRSRLSGIATGDQGIFVRKHSFDAAGGFEPIALMEDVALSKALRRLSRPVCLPARIVTSARRWEQQGVVKTVLLMWYLRIAYFLGADPDRLAELYYPGPAENSSGHGR